MENLNNAIELQGNEIVSVQSLVTNWFKIGENGQLKKSIEKKAKQNKVVRAWTDEQGQPKKLIEIPIKLNNFDVVQRSKKDGFTRVSFANIDGFELANINLELKGRKINEILRDALTYAKSNLVEKQRRSKFNNMLKKAIEDEQKKIVICTSEGIDVEIDNGILYDRLRLGNLDGDGFPLHTKFKLILEYNNNVVSYLIDAKSLTDNKATNITCVNLGLNVLDEE